MKGANDTPDKASRRKCSWSYLLHQRVQLLYVMTKLLYVDDQGVGRADFDVWLENRDAFVCAVTTVSSMFILYEGRIQHMRCGIHDKSKCILA